MGRRPRNDFKGGTESFQLPCMALVNGMIVASMNAPTRPLTVINHGDTWADCEVDYRGRKLTKRYTRETLVPHVVSLV